MSGPRALPDPNGSLELQGGGVRELLRDALQLILRNGRHGFIVHARSVALSLRALLITESRRSIREGAAARMAALLSRYRALRRRRCRSRCASHSSTLQVAEGPSDALFVVAEHAEASITDAAEPAAELS